MFATLKSYALKHGAAVASFLTALVLWEIAVRVFEVPAYLIPGPSAISSVFQEKPTLLFTHSAETLKAIVFGYLLAVLVGTLLAVVFVSSRFITKTIYPLVIAMQTIPKVAVAPLFVIWFGFGIESKVLVTFLICFFPILVNSILGFVSVMPELIGLARSMGAGPLKIFTKIRIPSALPSIFSGLKIAIMSAVIGAIVSEFVGSNEGLGYLLLVARGTLETELMFAVLVILSAMGISLYVIVCLLERMLMPWHVSQRVDNQIS